VTRGQLPPRAGSLGLTAVGLPPRYPLVTLQKDWGIGHVFAVFYLKRKLLYSAVVETFTKLK